MSARLTLALAALTLCGACTKSTEPAAATGSLVGDVKRVIAERDRRLSSYRVTIDSTEGEDRAHHEFAFKSPNKSRGRVFAPEELEVAFDGTQLVRLRHAEKRFEVVPLDLPVQERAYALARTFTAFVPEGYRAPLLPLAGVEAKPVKHPKAAEAVELSVSPEPGITVTWVLRMPQGDFLEKRTQANGQERRLRVEAERCDEKLALCVPTKLVETVGDHVLGTTEVTAVELNPELPQDLFAPKKPADWP